jgi:hypothetical protein
VKIETLKSQLMSAQNFLSDSLLKMAYVFDKEAAKEDFADENLHFHFKKQ